MANGGGTFLSYNKVLPGSYINFVSAARATVNVSDRGFAAIAMELDWGVEGEIFTVENGDFQTDTLKIFGYDYTHEKMKPLRDLFMKAQTVYMYRLNGGGTKAANTYATAKYSGTRGNDITIIVKANVDEEDKKDVTTMIGDIKVDVQTVTNSSELVSNNYVDFKTSELTETAGAKLTGGTNLVSVTGTQHQEFLDLLESFSFNVVGCTAKDPIIQKLYINWTKRMRDEVGVKFQCVVYREAADYEGVINLQNKVLDSGAPENALVYWLTGAEASCAVNATLTNTKYDGEYTIDTKYTQSQLEAGIKAGQLLFHNNAGEPYVLTDINSLTTITVEKNDDFTSNQVIRVLDQIGNDIAMLFNTKHLGHTRNIESGREALWKDIVAHHQELERIQALENFDPKAVTVEKGPTKKSVIVNDPVTPVACMEILYMTVVVS
ncbi:phage tail sheath family protein [Fusobacterium mortiferum]|uniref:Phage tail sheath family protein n=1 Tax=Fusobacterium mortiferum TaxID=850 RepID=A0ABS2G206_FUSMR|nr:phage tail sheath family protein [Fusobacterium mortiferum]MBM6875459.1 phage tail sheath family protein [Fusobacterium mortiferum]